MKTTVKSETTVVVKEIDYENGIRCEYIVTDGSVTLAGFFNKDNARLTLVDEKTIEVLKNTHWSKHHELCGEIPLSESWLQSFTDFDRLFYVGGGWDGMLTNADGKFISTPIILDEVFCQIYAGIETSESECEDILNSLKSEYIAAKGIVHIPYYNQNEDRLNHFTLTLHVKLPDDIYLQILGDKKSFDDTCKKETFDFLHK